MEDQSSNSSYDDVTTICLKGWEKREPQKVVEKVYERQAQQLFYQAWAHNIGSVLVAVCATIALWRAVEHSRLLVWLTVFTLIYVCRWIIALRFHKAAPKGDMVRKWVLYQFVAIVASALAYGAPALFLWPEGFPQEQMVWVITITAVTAAAVARYCVWKHAELPFILFALFPISLRLFFHEGLTYTILGILGIMYSVVLLQIARVMHRANLENLLMGAKNQQLSAELVEEVEKVTHLNRQLGHEMEERERAFTIMRQTEKELEQAKRMEAIGVLSGGVAHEINTPLQFIGNNLQFLGEGLQALEFFASKIDKLKNSDQDLVSKEAIRAYIDEARENADIEFYLEEMVQARNEAEEGILQISKIVRALGLHASSETAGIKTADINEAVESAILLSHTTWKDVCTVTTNFQENLPVISCSAKDIYQIILGILMNSIQAIQDKKKSCTFDGEIVVTTSYAEKRLKIIIGDNGVGIPDAIREKVFEDFFTTRELGEGVGQGLSFAYRALKKNGGTITFQSKENVGSTFIIELPGDD